MLGLSDLATDSQGNVIVATTSEFADSGALVKVRVSDGSTVWQSSYAPDSATAVPIVLANGVVDVLGYDASQKESIFPIEGTTGSYVPTTFGFDLYDMPPDPAVGSDGSLYFVHEEGVGTVLQQTYVSRVAPDGTVRWTSVDLGTLVPTPMYDDGEVDPSTIVLEANDQLILLVGDLTPSGEQTVGVSLDAASGAVLFTSVVKGTVVGGPVILPDGSVVALLDDGLVTNIVVFDRANGAVTRTQLTSGAFEIFAVTRAGNLLIGADDGSGVKALVSMDTKGSSQWLATLEPRSVTIASDGTILVFGADITAIDPGTGATKWVLAPPDALSCLMDAALTSDGGIVGLECDGLLFGAYD
jgi:hypothetical protein